MIPATVWRIFHDRLCSSSAACSGPFAAATRPWYSRLVHDLTQNSQTGSRDSGSISTGLLGRVRAQQAEAWQELVRLFGPVVYSWCRQSGVRATDSADVAQEVFRAVASSVGDFHRDRPRGSFRGWMWTITRNKIRDHFRCLKRQPPAEGGTDAQERLARLPAGPPQSSPIEHSDDGSRSFAHPALQRVCAEFEDRTWSAFWLTTVDKQPAAVVAGELGMTCTAVWKAKSRVMRRIREELGDLLG